MLGAKNVPSTLDKFVDMKYNDSEKWEELKYYYRNIKGRPIEYVKIDRELELMGITGKGKAYPSENIVINGWRTHAEQRLKQSNLTKDTALQFKNEAIAAMKRYPNPNTQVNYYSKQGILGIKESDGIVQTVIGCDRYGTDTNKILEVMEKWLK